MKCMACKFKTSYNEDFLEIEGGLINRRPQDYAPDSVDQISLYACPKCGTVRMSGWHIADIQNDEED